MQFAPVWLWVVGTLLSKHTQTRSRHKLLEQRDQGSARKGLDFKLRVPPKPGTSSPNSLSNGKVPPDSKYLAASPKPRSVDSFISLALALTRRSLIPKIYTRKPASLGRTATQLRTPKISPNPDRSQIHHQNNLEAKAPNMNFRNINHLRVSNVTELRATYNTTLTYDLPGRTPRFRAGNHHKALCSFRVAWLGAPRPVNKKLNRVLAKGHQ